MIIILKIILGLMVVFDFLIARLMFLDFKRTKKLVSFEESSIADKTKLSVVFYFVLLALCVFALLLCYLIIIPIQIV